MFKPTLLVKGQDIVENESLKEAGKMAKMSDKDIEECLKQMNDSKTKNALMESTKEALEYGVYHFALISSYANEIKLDSFFAKGFWRTDYCGSHERRPGDVHGI